MELESKENLENEQEDIPEMKMDVMGLDHSAIMARVGYILINEYLNIFY